MKTLENVGSYIAGAPKEVRDTLVELRRVIKKAAPKATERVSYGMPFYEVGGSGYKGRLIYFAAFKKHISVFIPPSFGGYPIVDRSYRMGNGRWDGPGVRLKEHVLGVNVI